MMGTSGGNNAAFLEIAGLIDHVNSQRPKTERGQFMLEFVRGFEEGVLHAVALSISRQFIHGDFCYQTVAARRLTFEMAQSGRCALRAAYAWPLLTNLSRTTCQSP